MKRIIGILCLLAFAGCGGAMAPDIEVVQGALNPPVTGPVSAAQPFSPAYELPGYTAENAPGGFFGQRPQMGTPAWTSTVAYYVDPPPACCLAQYSHFTMPDNRMGMGEVMVWTRDRLHYPTGGFNHPGPGYYANAWGDDIPLRSPTSGYPQSGPIYYIADYALGNEPEQKNGLQITYLIMDWYAHVKICTNSNLTGICREFGFGCVDSFDGRCHGDTAAERANSKAYTDVDVTYATQDSSGNLLAHLSIQIGYGF